jgi:hypothetical protein
LVSCRNVARQQVKESGVMLAEWAGSDVSMGMMLLLMTDRLRPSVGVGTRMQGEWHSLVGKGDGSGSQFFG